MKDKQQKEINFSLSEVVQIGILRSAAGIGIGLLLADSLSRRNRKTLGLALFFGSVAVGLPLGGRILRRIRDNF